MNGVGGGNTGNNNGGNGNENQTDKVVRYCRTLGIDPVVLGLASATPLRRLQKEGERKDQEDENQDKNQDEDDGDQEGDPFLYGFGLAGRDPIERLRIALRAATRVPPSLLVVVVVVVLVLVVVVVVVAVVVVVVVVVLGSFLCSVLFLVVFLSTGHTRRPQCNVGRGGSRNTFAGHPSNHFHHCGFFHHCGCFHHCRFHCCLQYLF
jgi:hypothetical protein